MPPEDSFLELCQALALISGTDAGVVLLDRFENARGMAKRLGHLFELKLRTSLSEDASGFTLFNYFTHEKGALFLLALDGLSRTKYRSKLGKRIVPALVTLTVSLLTQSPEAIDFSSLSSATAASLKRFDEDFDLLKRRESVNGLFGSLAAQVDPSIGSPLSTSPPAAALILACRALKLLGHLAKDNFALRELVITSRLQTLLSLISGSDPKNLLLVKAKADAPFVHQRVLHLFTVIVMEVMANSGGGGREEKWIQLLSKQGFITCLMGVISSATIPPSIITLAAELLVYSIRASVQFSLLFATDFLGADGYNVLVTAILNIGSRGSKSEQIAFPLICARLMNVDMSLTKRPGIANVAIVQTLIRALEKCSSFDTRSVLVVMIRDILLSAKREDRLVIIFELNLYTVLLGCIARFSLADREVLLKIIDFSVDDGTFSLSLRRYVALALDATPSVALLVSRHVVSMLSIGRLSRAQLREAGLVTVLTDYFRTPSTFTSLTDRLEIMTSLSILGEVHTGSSSDLTTLSGGVMKQMIRLACVFFVDNAADQAAFVRSGAFQSLLSLLDKPSLRCHALSFLVILAAGDVLLESKITVSLAQTLKVSIPMDSILSNMDLLKDTLLALAMVFDANPSMISEFGESGGFPWIASLLSVLGADPVSASSQKRAFVVFQSVFALLSSTLSSPAAQVRFEAEIGIAHVLRVLETSSFLSQGSHALQSLELLLNLGVTSFPPCCNLHPRCSVPSDLHSFEYLPPRLVQDQLTSHEVAAERFGCDACLAGFGVKYAPLFKHLTRFFGRVCADINSPSPPLSAMSHRAYLSAFKAFALSFEANSILRALSTKNLIRHIIEAFQSTLLSAALTEDGLLRRNLALGLIHRLSQYSISLREFKSLMALMHRESYPPVLIDTLSSVCYKDQMPTQFLTFPKREFARITCPYREGQSLTNWPPSRGYTMAFWFSLVRGSNVMLFNVSSPQSTAKIACGIDEGGFYVRSMRHFEAAFDSFKVQPGKWYHVVVSHVCVNPPAMTLVTLFVNGIKTGTQQLMYPVGEMSQLHCNFGTAQPTRPKAPGVVEQKRNSAAEWQLGNVYLFDCAVRDDEAFLLYYLGPDYVGNLDVKIDQTKVYDHANEDEIRAHLKDIEILDPTSNKLSLFKERIICAFSVRSMGYAKFEADRRSLLEFSADVRGNIVSESRKSGKDILPHLGGMSVLVYLVVTAQTTEQRVHGINAIQNALEWSAANVADMLACGGYGILARAMRKEQWALDENILGALFRLCGLKKSRVPQTYSLGVIKNLPAFEVLLLDWYIWNRAPKPIRVLLLASIADMLDPEHPMAFFNVGRLRQAQCRPILLRLLQEPDLGFKSASLVVSSVLARILRDPWDRADIDDIFQFIIATHSAEQNQMRDYPSKLLSSPLSLEQYRSPSKSASHAKSVAHKTKIVRDLILEMVAETIDGPNGSLIGPMFFSNCTMRVLFLLVQTEVESTRVIVLRLLARFLATPENLASFLDYNGFYALGIILRGLKIGEHTLGALFSLMFGERERGFLATYFAAGRRVTDANLRHPECVVTILLALSNATLSRALKHHALRVLHDIFLHLEKGKLLLIKNDAIELLCSLLASEHELKAQGSPIHDGDALEAWQIEEDLMAFLRAICLYNCDLTLDANSLRFILLAIHSLTLPVSYSAVLQYRLIYDVLLFYQESSLTDTKLLVLFERILILAIVHCGYLEAALRQRRATLAPRTSTETLSASTSFVGFESMPSSPTKLSSSMQLPKLSASTPLPNPMARSVGTVDWNLNPNLQYKDRALVRLIFAIASYLGASETESSIIGKLNKTIQRARQGVDQDFKWHFERYVYQLLRSPVTDAFILSFVFTTLADADLAAIAANEYEFVARCFFYSQDFLKSADQDVATSARTFWKVILLKGRSFLTKIVFHPPVGASSFATDVFKIILVDTLPKKVGDWEEAEKRLLEKNTAEYTSAKQASKDAATQRSAALRALRDKITEHTLGLYQTMMKPLYSHVRTVLNKEQSAKRSWKKMLKRMTHQRACFPLHPSLICWELDPTEGPMRSRVRLEPLLAHLHPIIQQLLASPTPEKKASGKKGSGSGSGNSAAEIYREHVDIVHLRKLHDLFALFDGPESSDFVEEAPKLDILQDESILHVFDVTNVTPFHNRDGNMLVGEYQLYFVDEHQFEDEADAHRKITSVRKNLAWPYEEIKEVYKRRILLKDTGLEIFLINGRTSLVGFQNSKERNLVYDHIMRLELPHLQRDEAGFFTFGQTTKVSVTEQWQKGLITNFEYLMHLNTLAGRTYNDLTQYPVFPFLLADYDSDELVLSDPNAYRDLRKPMGAQDVGRLQKFEEKYKGLESMGEQPYHYGSHYSTIGGVLHFLARLEPFARYLIEFQGGKFDIADRMFQSIKTTWEQSSRVSSSDVKELTPEFFVLSNFLVNHNRFDLGTKQNGEKVADIKLPTWAKASADKFVEIHREALESDFVSSMLHHWIDLIFGYKQTGKEAVEAKNVFFPLTYEGAVDVDKITDPVQKLATITQISNFGQVPKKLFTKPHPERLLNELPSRSSIATDFDKVFSSIHAATKSAVGCIDFINGQIVALKPYRTILWDKDGKSSVRTVVFGSWDGCIRLLSGNDNKLDKVLDLPALQLDETTCVSVSRDGTVIAAGSRSSVVRVWRRKPRYLKTFKRQVETRLNQRLAHVRSNSELSLSVPNSPKIDRPRLNRTPSQLDIDKRVAEAVRKNKVDVSFVRTLNGHDGEVTCIKASSEFSVIVSGSTDRSCIVFDSNRVRFVRSLDDHLGPIVGLDIHPFTGDVAVIDDPGNGFGTLHLWTINGEKRSVHRCNPRASAIAFSRVKPGVSRDFIVTGHVNGEINIWLVPSLKLLRTIRSAHSDPVTALAVHEDNQRFVSGDLTGNCCIHEIRGLD